MKRISAVSPINLIRPKYNNNNTNVAADDNNNVNVEDGNSDTYNPHTEQGRGSNGSNNNDINNEIDTGYCTNDNYIQHCLEFDEEDGDYYYDGCENPTSGMRSSIDTNKNIGSHKDKQTDISRIDKVVSIDVDRNVREQGHKCVPSLPPPNSISRKGATRRTTVNDAFDAAKHAFLDDKVQYISRVRIPFLLIGFHLIIGV